MKTLKTIAASLLMVSLFATAALSQDKKKETLKEHKCTAACTKAKHAYAHGEKGHTCGEACKKMMEKKGKG